MAPPTRVLIVDDEALARLRLRSLIDAMPEAGALVVGEASDAVEAMAWLQRGGVDALLLDIRMPGAHAAQAGLRLATAIKALPQPPLVVFISAHHEHALTAFDLDAVDYLTKPVRRERLLAALQRVAQRLRPATEAPAAGPALVVNDRGRVLRLPFAEVLYLKAGQKYVALRTAEHSHVLDESLSELHARLGEGFIRIHRNALVAVSAIRELALRDAIDAGDDADTGDERGEPGTSGWAVRVAPLDEWLAVSRRQVAAVRAALAVS
jgi:two-component system, LytTR family, response regulator AlgR